MLSPSLRPSFLRRVLLATCAALVAATGLVAQGVPAHDMAFYFGGAGHQRLHAAHQLSDGSFVLGGSADDFGWVPVGVPVVVLPATGIASATDGPAGFLLHLSADLKTPLRVLRFPAGTVGAVRHVRGSEVPGQPTGILVFSAERLNSIDPLRTLAGFNAGYVLARLDANFVTGAPTGLAWTRDVNATGLFQSIQPWDLGGDGRVVFASGDSNSGGTAWLDVVTADNAWLPMPGWRVHHYADGSSVTADFAIANAGPSPVVRSRFVLANTGGGGPRSRTWADFDAIVPDGNGGWRKGRNPQDLYGYGPNTAGGRGYTGYRASSYTFGVGMIAVDRRDNAIYVPHNTQTNHADNQPDFEPAFTALSGDGSLRWWSRLYTEFSAAEGVARSTDAAGTFAAANAGLANRFVRAVAAHPTTAGVVLAGTYDGVFRSTDAGATWSRATGLPTGTRVTRIAFGPGASVPRAWAATDRGAFLSDDGGATWSAAATAPADPYLTTIVPHPTNPSVAWAGTGGSGVFRTADAGATWAASSSGLEANANNLWVSDLAVDPQDASVLYAALGGGWGIGKSTDGGATWVSAANGTPRSNWADYGFTVAVHRPTPASVARVWFGSNDGAFRSDDGGASWVSAVPSGTLLTQVRVFALHPTDRDRVYAGTNYRGLFRTTDAGLSWTRQNTGLSFTGQTVSSLHHVVYGLAVDPLAPDTVYLGSLGFPWGSIPDQYGDGAAVDYSRPLGSAEVMVVARAHGSDVQNLWPGNSISLANNPAFPGGSYHNRWTGTNGNIHTSWMGKFRAADGALLAASWLAEGVYSNSQSVGNVSAIANHDGWPDRNGGNPDLNTTRTDSNRPAFDATGRPIVTAVGRLVHTTLNAFAKVPNKYRRVPVTEAASGQAMRFAALVGNEQLQPGFATLKFTASGANQNLSRVITAFNPATGLVTLDSALPAVPAAGAIATIDEGGSNWSWFVRALSPDWTRLDYSSIVTGDFDRTVMGSATGGDNTRVHQAIPVGDGVLVVGYHTASGGVSRGNPMPTRAVPGWGSAAPTGEEAIVARLVYDRAPQVYVEALATTLSEAPGAASASAFRFTRVGGNLAAPLAVPFQVLGTAVNGSDLAALPGEITFAAGATTAELAVATIDDARSEADETVTLALRSDDTRFYAGRLGAASMTIIDDDGPGRLRFDAASATVAAAEGTTGATLSFVVERTGGTAGAISVAWQTVDGTAVAGADYVAAGGTLSWASGDFSTRTVTVTVLPDGVDEDTESFSLVLSAPTGGASLAAPATATGEIVDTYVPGSIGFTQATVPAERARGLVNLVVLRTGGSSGAVSATWRTVPVTASEGSDFVGASGLVAWAHEDVSPRLVTVFLPEVAAGAPAENFRVILGDATGGVAVSPSETVVELVDPRGPGSVFLAQAAASVVETSPSVGLTVRRAGGDLGAVSVTWETVAGTAVAGTHYVAASGTLDWADGDEDDRRVTIPVLGPATADGPRTFGVRLVASTPAGRLGAVTETTVTILDDDLVPVRWNNAAATLAWNATDANWTSADGLYRDGDLAKFDSLGRTGTSSTIAIAAGGVAPSLLHLDAVFANNTTYRFGGGPLTGPGGVLMSGNSVVVFGPTSSERYASSMTHAGGTHVRAGILDYLVATPGAPASFGTGPIVLDGGRFRLIANASAFTNDFVVTATGGNLTYNSSLNAIAVNFAGDFEVGGPLVFSGTGGGNLSGLGHLVSGDLWIDGEQRIRRTENHGNTNFTISGNLRDGRSPAKVRLASEVDRVWYLAGTDNTWSGGTVIESNLKALSSPGNSANYSTNRAIVVEPASRLGTGDVEIQSGGFLVLRGAGNLHPDATLVVATGGVLTVETGVTVPIGGLVVGGVVQPAGLYGAAELPGVLFGGGALLVVPPVVNVEPGVPVARPGEPGSFVFRRLGATSRELTVALATGGTSVAGLDHAALPAEVVFPAGVAEVEVQVGALRDPGSARDLVVTLSGAAGWRVGGTGVATVVVAGSAGPGGLRWTATSLTADEAGAVATLSVERVGGTAGAVGVPWQTANLTAEAPRDYAASSGTLAWADGEGGAKSISVPVVNDVFKGPARSFRVALGTPTGGAGLLGQATADVAILDDDGLVLAFAPEVGETRSWDATQPVWSGPFDRFRDGAAVVFPTAAAGNVAIAAGGVNPSSTVFDTTSTYTFTGGLVGGGPMTKSGSGTVVFGTSSARMAGSFPFAGDLVVSGGQVHFETSVTGAPVTFGTGTIRLDGGWFRYVAGGLDPRTSTLGVLMNPIVVGPAGGTLQSRQTTSSRSASFGGPVDLHGNLSFRGVGGGNGSASDAGDAIVGPVRLHGTITITREDRHNNAGASILGAIQDGSSPGSLRIVNRLDRDFNLEGVSTYTGTTTFIAGSTIDPADPTLATNRKFAVTLRPSAVLGHGDVTIAQGGYAWFLGSGNLRPHVRLTMATGGFAVLGSGVDLVVRVLDLGGTVHTEGTFSAATHPGFFLPHAGATGQVRVVYVPDAPSGLVAEEQGTGAVALSWTDNSLVAVPFALERRELPAGAWVQVAEVAAPVGGAAPGHVDTGLAAATSYAWRVRAVGANGNSAWSSEVEATTLAPGVPSAPADLVARGVAPDAVQLLWDVPAGGPTGYRVERHDGSGWTLVSVLSGGAHAGFLHEGLEPGSSHVYRVAALNAAGTSGWSNLAAVTTPPSLRPFQVWTADFFTSAEQADPLVSGASADPDRDGLPNLLEYALGRDPRSAGGATFILPSVGGAAESYPTFTYRRRIGATSITYRVQLASALAGPWSTPTLEQVGASTATGDGITEQVTVRLPQPWSSNAPFFVRLVVADDR